MIPLLLQEILFFKGNCTDEYLQFLLMIFENFSLKKMMSHFKCLEMIFNKSDKIYDINVKHYKQLLRFLLIYEHSNELFKPILIKSVYCCISLVSYVWTLAYFPITKYGKSTIIACYLSSSFNEKKRKQWILQGVFASIAM